LPTPIKSSKEETFRLVFF